MTERQTQRALWVLLFGNLVIGTGVLLPAGILTALMADLQVPASKAGMMMTVGGLVVGLGAPLLAATTSAINRRLLLVASLLLYVAGHLASALTGDLHVLLALRAITVAGAAVFTPQAAATVGLIVPPERRGSAIAFIFIGWSLASVLGIPAGSLLASAIGWRETFALMAGLSAIGAVAVWLALPGGLRVAPLHLSSWGKVLTDGRLMMTLAVTSIVMGGQFTLFTYISPVLRQVYALDAKAVALTLMVSGAAGVAGSIIATRLASRLGLPRSVLVGLVVAALGVGLMALGWGQMWALWIGVVLWNLGGFPINSLQQGRLVTLAPALASATVALNTSFVYLGQSFGAFTGGQLIAGGPTTAMPLTSMGFLILAMIVSQLAARMRAAA